MKFLRNPLVWIALLSLPFFLVDLGKPALTDSEAMYAEIAREMHQGGDWITPRINETRHFDKPPLLFWLVGLSQAFLGETEAAARIWPALATWATIILVGAIGTSLYGRRAGWLSALVFAGSLGPYIFSRLARPDPVLCFLTTLAILSYTKSLMEEDEWTGIWPWTLFISLGIAGLTKGMLGIGLPVAIIGAHAIASRKTKSLFSWQAAAGIVVATVIFIPWHISIANVNPDFLEHYFIREHILRFSGQRFPVDEFLSVPVFLGFTILWTFPWMPLLPGALARAFRRLRKGAWGRGKDLLPCLWVVVVVGLFTASRSRLEYYSLPAIPAIALLLGKMWDEVLQEKTQSSHRSVVIALGAVCAILGLAAVAAWEVLGPLKDVVFRFVAVWWPESGWIGTPDQASVLERIHLPTVIVLAGSAIFTMGALVALKTARPRLACGLLVGMMAPIFVMVHWGFILMEPFQSSRPVADILKRTGPADIIVFQEPREYSWTSGLVFYTKRYIHVLKDPRFDGDHSRRREPPERFLDQGELLKLWESGRSVALVLENSWEGEALRLLRFEPVNVVGRLGARVVIATGRAAAGSGKREGVSE